MTITLNIEGGTSEPARALEITEFWIEAGMEKWFSKDDAFDAEIRNRFLSDVEAARNGQLDGWAATAAGALALVILLDQFPRNLYRGSPQSFASDERGVAVADHALSQNYHCAFPRMIRGFFFLPYMHQENMAHQELCIDLCRTLALKEHYNSALAHMDVIRRFGRFPHRNPVLGRESTPQELQYLENGGFSA